MQTTSRRATFTLGDGLGTRWFEATPEERLTVLDVNPALLAVPAAEDAIRARAADAAAAPGHMAAVRRIEADGRALRVVSAHVEGLCLSELLVSLTNGTSALSPAGAFELACRIVRAAAALHAHVTPVEHGAITPAHVVLRPDGEVAFTDGIFGGVLEGLRWNREQIWIEFGIALPALASLPRFDRRADVTQVGAVALAVLLRRPLRSDEYPKRLGDLLREAAAASAPGGVDPAELLGWLTDALQLNPRAAFSSLVAAERALLELRPAPGEQRQGALALRAILHARFATAGRRVAVPPPARVARPPAAPKRIRLAHRLRGVFPSLLANW